MLYEFECECGYRQEETLPMAQRDDFVRCNNCGAQSTRIIACKIERQEPRWLDDMKHQLSPRDRGSVTDRSSWNKVLKEKGLVAI